jgi:hypothetical protein
MNNRSRDAVDSRVRPVRGGCNDRKWKYKGCEPKAEVAFALVRSSL